jgi:hypothetical protein
MHDKHMAQRTRAGDNYVIAAIKGFARLRCSVLADKVLNWALIRLNARLSSHLVGIWNHLIARFLWIRHW